MNASGDSDRDVRRGSNFGILRLLFAALVVVSHSPELIDGNRSRELLTRLFGTLSFGELAVDGFFLISGYLILKSYRNAASVWDYLAKRVLRIYPGFIAASLVAILLVAPISGGHLASVSPFAAMIDMVTLTPPKVPCSFEGIPGAELNGAMWTVRYEFRCYLLVILLGGLASRANRRGYAMLLACLTALYLLRPGMQEIQRGGPLFLLMADMARFAFVFFIGGAFYVWRDRIAYHRLGALMAGGALIPLLFVAPLAEAGLATFGGYLIFWYAFACPTSSLSRMTDHTDPSYGLYLYAWPIQSLIVASVPGIAPWVVTAATLPLGLMLGVLSWRLIEKPALRHKDIFLTLTGKTATP
ncbi:acyltransferase family protein [Methylobacterium marchantiae]|uniref:Acyltransferase family protein n=1 Tax=Methylobacterium marchantiae TaxID=600331 RepID=A0ABW3WXA4_9HYPH|nr:hypothetical protein AIGOOFII_1894 [Methylobacterium marchantiae]